MVRITTEQLTRVSRMDSHTILYEIEGPATLHQLLEISDKQMPHIHAITKEHGYWCALLRFHTSCIMTPDCLGAAFGEMQRLKANNHTAFCSAYVIPSDIAGHGIMEPIYAKFHADTTVNFQTFEALDAAKTWIVDQRKRRTEHVT